MAEKLGLARGAVSKLSGRLFFGQLTAKDRIRLVATLQDIVVRRDLPGKAAIQQSQRNAHTHTNFLRKTMAADCVGYFVLISGRCEQYFGRRGEIHVEAFCSPAPT